MHACINDHNNIAAAGVKRTYCITYTCVDVGAMQVKIFYCTVLLLLSKYA